MQHRMRDYPLSLEEIQKFLAESQAGTVATVGPDGVPYCVPVHFVYVDGAVYSTVCPRGRSWITYGRTPRCALRYTSCTSF